MKRSREVDIQAHVRACKSMQVERFGHAHALLIHFRFGAVQVKEEEKNESCLRYYSDECWARLTGVSYLPEWIHMGFITNNTETHGERGNRCRTHECFVTLVE